MKNTVKIILVLLIVNMFAQAQTQPTTHLQWFTKSPDDCAEVLAEKFEKLNMKLISINDVEQYEYDKRGKKTKTIKGTIRLLELPDEKVIQIEYDVKGIIKSFAISTADLSDIAEFASLFAIKTWSIVVEDPEFIMKTTNGYFSKFYINTQKRPSGLETKTFSLFIEKETQQSTLAKENVPVFSVDSLSIYTNTEKLKTQLVATLESLGQKYLITESEEPILSESGDLEYYSQSILFKGGLTLQVLKKPSNNLSEINISCQNPILFLKIKRAFILPTMEQVSKEDEVTKFRYRNLEVEERSSQKILSIIVYPYENDIAGRLATAPTLSFDQLMNIYEKYKGDIIEKERYVAKIFLNKVKLDWTNKTLMPDLKYNEQKDFTNYFYFLSPTNKLVACRIMSNITPAWTAIFIVDSEDTDYLSKLLDDFKKSKRSNFEEATGKIDGTTAFQLRIHDMRKEEERKRNEVQEKQDQERRQQESAELNARIQARKDEQFQRGMNSLNSILNQVQQQVIKK